MDPKPYFSRKLLCTAPDGAYCSFGGSKKISAYPDRIEIGKTAVPYARIIDILVLGNVLHIIHSDPSGKRVENYFRYDTFLAKKANRELMAFLETARTLLPRPPAGAAADAAGPRPAAPAAERARRIPPVKGREAVALFSASAAFPPYCPVCLGSVARVARLDVGTGLESTGFWLVPVCNEHRSLGGAVKVHGWKAKSGEITFSFAQATYADHFHTINAAPERRPFASVAASSQALHDLRNGTRAVVHQYVISLVHVSFIRTSAVSLVRSRGEAVWKGLPYIFSTLVTGWWAIPGLIWTPVAVYRNLRGGIDVTPLADQALTGVPISARGV